MRFSRHDHFQLTDCSTYGTALVGRLPSPCCLPACVLLFRPVALPPNKRSVGFPFSYIACQDPNLTPIIRRWVGGLMRVLGSVQGLARTNSMHLTD